MKVCYADPPYLGLAAQFYATLHPDAAAYDKIETHAALIERIDQEYDAWALSLHSPSLKRILALCPDDVRVGAWVKPFCSFKLGVSPAYAWEPIIFRGARKHFERDTALTVRDYCAVSITLRTGFATAKPEGMCFWMFELLGASADDDFSDIFPGSGGVLRAWEKWRSQRQLFASAPYEKQQEDASFLTGDAASA